LCETLKIKFMESLIASSFVSARQPARSSAIMDRATSISRVDSRVVHNRNIRSEGALKPIMSPLLVHVYVDRSLRRGSRERFPPADLKRAGYFCASRCCREISPDLRADAPLNPFKDPLLNLVINKERVQPGRSITASKQDGVAVFHVGSTPTSL